jgi:hypothetical protein
MTDTNAETQTVIEEIIPDTADTTNVTQDTDPVAALVGEGKKFRDVAALAAGKVESDKFIEQLKRETADLRKELAQVSEQTKSQLTMTEILEALNRRPEANGDDDAGQPQPKAISLEDISRLVKATNAAEKAADIAKANRMSVNRELLKLAGGNAETAKKLLATRTLELGLSSDQVRDMSERSPAALLALIGTSGTTNGTQSTSSTTRSKVNTEALLNNANTTGERKLSWYTAKRKEMGVNKFYSDFALQAQYQADLKRHGDSFVDTKRN